MLNPASALFGSVKRSPGIYLALAALAFALVSGLRLPNIWSATHFLFDYSEGFIKRGLLGQVLTPLVGHSVNYGTLAAISYAVCAVWLVMFLVRLRVIARTDQNIWLIAAVVMLSPGFVFLMHEIGYFDHISLVVVFSCFLMPGNWWGLLARVILCVSMILIHETFFVLFFPAVLIEFWIRAALGRVPGTILAVCLLAFAAAAASYAMVQITLPLERQDAYLAHIESRAADFEIRPTAVKVLFRDGEENLELNAKVWKNRKRWVEAFAAAVFLLPLPAALVLICWSLLARLPLERPLKMVLGAGVAAGAVSPAFLNIIGWDLWRFFALSQVSSLAMLIAVATRANLEVIPPAYVKPATYILAIFAVVGAATSIPLFDNYIVEKPPYVSLMNYVIDGVQGDIPWISIPKR